MDYDNFINGKQCREKLKTAFLEIVTKHLDELNNIFAKSQGLRWNSDIEKENESASLKLYQTIAQIVSEQKGLNFFERKRLAIIIRDYLTEQRMKQPNEEKYYNVK